MCWRDPDKWSTLMQYRFYELIIRFEPRKAFLSFNIISLIFQTNIFLDKSSVFYLFMKINKSSFFLS